MVTKSAAISSQPDRFQEKPDKIISPLLYVEN